MKDPTTEFGVVLVIDDIEANRALARATLEDEGYRVVEASGGAQGIRAFEEHKPDCILLDVRMPDMNGFVVCERIRALPGGRETPILFFTALRDVDTFDRAQLVGGDDFLTKPVRPVELAARVLTALKLRRTSAELREHYDLLKHQRDALLRVQLQKERLMAFVVHDLKNPVNAMDLFAQILMREKSLPEEARATAGKIRNEAHLLNRMILNLLDVSKGDEGRLSPKRAEVGTETLLAYVMTELEAQAKSRGVHVESRADIGTIRVDPDLVQRMLINLVENAIRHAPRDTAVTTECIQSPDGIELRIRDLGVGVPPEMRDKIFDPFVQVDASAERPFTRGGRGLGLAFCKLVAEAHGGSILVEDGAPGALFRVRLPT